MPQGFSFPLCGLRCAPQEDQVIHEIDQQMIFFAKYTRIQAITNYIQTNWHKGKVSFVEEVDHEGIRHVIASFRGNFNENFGYLYLDDDNLSEAQVKAKSHCLWRFIRDKCELEKPEGTHVVDSLQGKPTSKVRIVTETGNFKSTLL